MIQRALGGVAFAAEAGEDAGEGPPQLRHWKASASSPPTTRIVAPGQSDQALILRKPPTAGTRSFLSALVCHSLDVRRLGVGPSSSPRAVEDARRLVCRKRKLGFPFCGGRRFDGKHVGADVRIVDFLLEGDDAMQRIGRTVQQRRRVEVADSRSASVR